MKVYILFGDLYERIIIFVSNSKEKCEIELHRISKKREDYSKLCLINMTDSEHDEYYDFCERYGLYGELSIEEHEVME